MAPFPPFSLSPLPPFCDTMQGARYTGLGGPMTRRTIIVCTALLL